MIGRESFRRYWKAGFIFAIVSSAVSSLLISFVNYVVSLSDLQEWRMEWNGTVTFVYPVQPGLIVIIVVVVITSLILVPALYGRLVEVIRNEFIIGKKT